MLKDWLRAHVLSTAGWTPENLAPLLDLASGHKKGLSEREDGALNLSREAPRLRSAQILLTLFFEPSTRTRLSFESAAHRLGMNVISVADAVRASSARKGESLEDMAKIVSAYGDVVVIRHPELGSAARFASASAIPVLNAGDGPGEHPTQSLVDLFTMREAFGSLKGLKVGLCGDLRYGRTIHSLLRLLILFDCEITAISPEELAIPSEVLQKIPGVKNHLRKEPDLRKVLPQLDVLYMTRVQKERFRDVGTFEKVRDSYRLIKEDLELAPSHLKVLHPLPRVNEIATDVDQDPKALYFAQSANGIPVRMALLSAILGIEGPSTVRHRKQSPRTAAPKPFTTLVS